MAKITRRAFLESGAALAAGLAAGGCATERAPEGRAAVGTSDPDQVLVNGRVFTVDDPQPTAEAFAIKDGRFVAVGASDDVRNLAGRRTQVIDAEGMTVTPGFIDAHTHPAGAGVSELKNVNLDLRSIAEIKNAIRARAEVTPQGEWIVGYKYDDTKVTDGRQLTIDDLNDAAPDHPVWVPHRGGHIYWANSRAFDIAGVTAETPDPHGGKIYRENGRLTGKVAERAREFFEEHLPSGSTREERQAGVKLISEMMTAAGLTSVHDAGATAEGFQAYEDAYRAGEMRFRVYSMCRGEPYRGGAIFDGLKAAGIRTGFGDEWLRVGGIKFTADGSASGRTMAMSTPYVGRPDDYGLLAMDQQQTHDFVEDAHRHGFQVGIHANGDVAIDMVLNAYERVQRLWPRPDPRHRLEHCSLINPSLLRRIKALGAIPTPFYTYVHYHGNKWVEYGPEKMQWMFAHRSFLDYGIPVASGSDYTPGPYEPLMAIQSMVTRKDFDGRVWGPNQRISVDEALRVCTINAAHAGFEEDLKGSVTAGKLADFVILADDPHQVDPDHIKEIQIVRTVVGGRTVYEG